MSGPYIGPTGNRVRSHTRPTSKYLLDNAYDPKPKQPPTRVTATQTSVESQQRTRRCRTNEAESVETVGSLVQRFENAASREAQEAILAEMEAISPALAAAKRRSLR